MSAGATGVNAILGISLTGGTTDNVSFNTVYLTGSTSGGASAINFSSTPTSVVLRNNIAYNTITPGGTAFTVALRSGSTTVAPGAAPTNLGSASNNNLYYASNVGNNKLYCDAAATINSYTTMAAYKAIAGLSPREQASVTENITASLANTATPASANYLHFTAGASTLAVMRR